MPRPRTHSKDDLIHRAMERFWSHGYSATSMDDLVKATGISRHGIYSDCGGKRALYLEGFAAYQHVVVSPAFAAIEQNTSGLSEIAAYFERQIALAAEMGLPGPGCLVANAMTEMAPHDPDVAAQVSAHNQRLKSGFANAISNEAPGMGRADIDALADFLVLSAQGLWSMSRIVETPKPLRRHAETLLDLLKCRITK